MTHDDDDAIFHCSSNYVTNCVMDSSNDVIAESLQDHDDVTDKTKTDYSLDIQVRLLLCHV